MSGGRGDGTASPTGLVSAGEQQQQQLTLAQELQTLIHELAQQPQQEEQEEQEEQGDRQAAAREQPQQQQPEQDAEEGPVGRRRSGVGRQIRHTSPAVPPPSQLPPQLAARGDGASSGGRRWRAPQPDPASVLAAQPRWAAPLREPGTAAALAGVEGSGGGGGGSSSFFSIDADLLQAHAQRQALHAAPGHARQHQSQRRRPQQRAVQWGSPQAAPLPQPPAEHTPQPSQRTNPLAALLGSGGAATSSSGGAAGAAKQRPATTGSRLRGRHPIYGAATTAGSGPAAGASDSGSRLRELGLRDAPLTSPRQLPAPRRQLQPQHQHSRFAIREAGADAAPDAASSQPQAAAARPAASALGGCDGGLTAATGLRLLTGSEPSSALRQQHFQPRPQRPPSPREVIEEEQVQEQEQARQQQVPGPPDGHGWQRQQPGQQQHGEPAHEAAAEGAVADHFRTPGQPLRRVRQEELGQEQGLESGAGGGAHAVGMAATPAAAAATPGSAGGTALSLQRQFIAQLQPVSRPAAAANMQQQRQRLAGAAGLHARMQAILAAERAGLGTAQSPAGGAAAGPRLTVLQKELEAGVTKCHCRQVVELPCCGPASSVAACMAGPGQHSQPPCRPSRACCCNGPKAGQDLPCSARSRSVPACACAGATAWRRPPWDAPRP